MWKQTEKFLLSVTVGSKKDGINFYVITFYIETFCSWNIAMNRNLIKKWNYFKLLALK